MSRPIQKGDIIRLHDSAWTIDTVIGHHAFCGPVKFWIPDLRHVANNVYVGKHGGYNSGVPIDQAICNGKGSKLDWKNEPI